MTLNDVVKIVLADYYVYSQLLFVCALLTVLFLVSRFSETVIIKSGIYLFAGCLTINFVLSFFLECYWYFVLHWFLSSVCFFIFWYLAIYICENFGRPYSGDGALVMVLPVHFLPVAIFISVMVKSLMMLMQRF